MPEFENDFLTAAHAAFVQRLRALRRHGDTSILLDEKTPAAWFTISTRPQTRPAVDLVLNADQRAQIILRAPRGRKLWTAHAYFVNNAAAIVQTFEASLLEAHAINPDALDQSQRERLDALWRSVQLRPVVD